MICSRFETVMSPYSAERMASYCTLCNVFFFLKQKTAYEMRISDWSSDVCSSDLESGVLPLYTLSHEPGAAFAADAAARFNCGLGVVAVTYGAGADRKSVV